MSNDLAAMQRRAVQMFNAWPQDVPSIRELIKESQASGDGRIDLVCSLLAVGSRLIEAAAAGKLDQAREQILGSCLIAEAIAPAPDRDTP